MGTSNDRVILAGSDRLARTDARLIGPAGPGEQLTLTVGGVPRSVNGGVTIGRGVAPWPLTPIPSRAPAGDAALRAAKFLGAGAGR